MSLLEALPQASNRLSNRAVFREKKHGYPPPGLTPRQRGTLTTHRSTGEQNDTLVHEGGYEAAAHGCTRNQVHFEVLCAARCLGCPLHDRDTQVVTALPLGREFAPDRDFAAFVRLHALKRLLCLNSRLDLGPCSGIDQSYLQKESFGGLAWKPVQCTHYGRETKREQRKAGGSHEAPIARFGSEESS